MTDISQDFVNEAIEEFQAAVERGRSGKNTGLAIRQKRTQRWVNGLHRARYYLIGADSGIGKTTEADDLLLDAWQDAKNKGKPFEAFYYSFEISRTEKIAKWVVRYLYREHNISMPTDYVMGRIEGKLLNDVDADLVKQALAWVKEVLKDIRIIDTPRHPTAMFNDIVDHMRSYGEVEYITGKDGKRYIRNFKSNNPDLYFFWVIDHLALAQEESGLDTKRNMDRISKFAVLLRNKFGVSPLFIQQFSTDMQSAERSKFKVTDSSLMPQRLDFGDSKYTYRDADVVWGMIKASKFDKAEFMGYELGYSPETGVTLGDYLVSMFLMKNRYGIEDRVTHMIINGMSGTLWEAPLSNDLFALEPMFSKLKELDQWQSHYQHSL